MFLFQFPRVADAALETILVVALWAPLMAGLPVVAKDKNAAQIEVSVRQTSDGPAVSHRAVLDALLHNRSASPIFFMQSRPEVDYKIDIVGPGGSSVELTTFARCVLPYPILISNMGRKLEPGEDDHIESVELNRLFKFKRIGRYRVVVRRYVWRTNSRFPSLSLEDWLFCHPQLCSDLVVVSSGPYSFTITSPQPDTSPKVDPAECR